NGYCWDINNIQVNMRDFLYQHFFPFFPAMAVWCGEGKPTPIPRLKYYIACAVQNLMPRSSLVFFNPVKNSALTLVLFLQPGNNRSLPGGYGYKVWCYSKFSFISLSDILSKLGNFILFYNIDGTTTKTPAHHPCAI